MFAWADEGTEMKVDVPVVFKGEENCPGLKKGTFYSCLIHYYLFIHLFCEAFQIVKVWKFYNYERCAGQLRGCSESEFQKLSRDELP